MVHRIRDIIVEIVNLQLGGNPVEIVGKHDAEIEIGQAGTTDFAKLKNGSNLAPLVTSLKKCRASLVIVCMSQPSGPPRDGPEPRPRGRGPGCGDSQWHPADADRVVADEFPQAPSRAHEFIGEAEGPDFPGCDGQFLARTDSDQARILVITDRIARWPPFADPLPQF